MEVQINKSPYRPVQIPSGPNPHANVVSNFHNTTGFENMGNIFGAGGLQAKVTVDLPDMTYLKIFGSIALGVGLGMTIGFTVNHFLKKRS